MSSLQQRQLQQQQQQKVSHTKKQKNVTLQRKKIGQ